MSNITVESVQYASQDNTLVNALLIVDGETLPVADLELTASAVYPQAISAWIAAGNKPTAYAGPFQLMTQDLLAQFTPSDFSTITVAIGANPQLSLLWTCLLGQQDAMVVGRPRFNAGWSALVKILGAPRMAAIAAALGITVSS